MPNENPFVGVIDQNVPSIFGTTDIIYIIRYKNRKLYNRNEGKYITLLDIVKYVHEGKKFSVTNRRFSIDLTRETLARAFVEHALYLKWNVTDICKMITGGNV